MVRHVPSSKYQESGGTWFKGLSAGSPDDAATTAITVHECLRQRQTHRVPSAECPQAPAVVGVTDHIDIYHSCLGRILCVVLRPWQYSHGGKPLITRASLHGGKQRSFEADSKKNTEKHTKTKDSFGRDRKIDWAAFRLARLVLGIQFTLDQ